MLSNENIREAMRAARANSPKADNNDLVFVILCDIFEDKAFAYHCAYGTDPMGGIEKAMTRPVIQAVMSSLKPFGVGTEKTSISREENQSALVAMLQQIQEAMDNHEVEKGQALKMMADIRVKLQDKFNMEEDKDEQKHIIIVPQKHDIICEFTNRECSRMPSKEACIKYYHLTERQINNTNKDQE